MFSGITSERRIGLDAERILNQLRGAIGVFCLTGPAVREVQAVAVQAAENTPRATERASIELPPSIS